MLDTSRHYLKGDTIRAVLDAMMYSKMNVLHWHVVDEDCFPLQVPSLPNLSAAGACDGQVYAPREVEEVIGYALRRGVRVVPEVDSPAHTGSWGRGLQPDDFIMGCGGPYAGQIDPSMDKAYSYTQTIWEYVLEQFPDEYLHAGGDEVNTGCWDQRPHIKEFMARNGIPSYQALEVYWRKLEKKDLRKVTNRSLIFWTYER